MLKIERKSDGRTTIIWLIGRIQSEHLDELRAQTNDNSERMILDLDEVTLVDADVVRFLSASEEAGSRWFAARFMCANGFCANEPRTTGMHASIFCVPDGTTL